MAPEENRVHRPPSRASQRTMLAISITVYAFMLFGGLVRAGHGDFTVARLRVGQKVRGSVRPSRRVVGVWLECPSQSVSRAGSAAAAGTGERDRPEASADALDPRDDLTSLPERVLHVGGAESRLGRASARSWTVVPT